MNRNLKSYKFALLRYAWLVVAMAVGLCTAQPQASQRVVIHLDPAQTEIHWTLEGNTHTVEGTFRLKSGTMSFDPKTGAAEGELLVETDTGASGSDSRDARMKSEVLETAKYPTASFRPTRVVGALQAGAAQDIRVEGTFTIHGADHPLTLPIHVQVVAAADGAGANGVAKATAATQFIVPYVNWGMKDPSVFVLRMAKQVSVKVTATGTIEHLP